MGIWGLRLWLAVSGESRKSASATNLFNSTFDRPRPQLLAQRLQILLNRINTHRDGCLARWPLTTTPIAVSNAQKHQTTSKAVSILQHNNNYSPPWLAPLLINKHAPPWLSSWLASNHVVPWLSPLLLWNWQPPWLSPLRASNYQPPWLSQLWANNHPQPCLSLLLAKDN